jgi:hypothetical protein
MSRRIQREPLLLLKRALVWFIAASGLLAARPARSDDSMRNPFWPVGHWPEASIPVEIVTPEDAKNMDEAAAALVERGWKEALRRLDVRGSSQRSDGRSIALVNKKSYALGEIVSLTQGDRVYRWKVVKIDLSGVTLERYNQNVVEPSAAPGGEASEEAASGTGQSVEKGKGDAL